MAIKTYNCTALTGGATRALDAISRTVLADGDRASVNYNNTEYRYLYVAAATDAEASPDIIRPNDYSASGVWKLQSAALTGDLYPLPSGTVLTGNINGLLCSRTGNNQVTITAGNCKDSANSSKLTLAASQAISSLPTTASGWIHFFLCDDGVARYDEDVTGATLLSAYRKRRIFSWQNTAGGVLKLGRQYGNILEFDINESSVLVTNPSTTPFVPTYTGGVIPTTIVRRVGLWVKYTSAGFAVAVSDGTYDSRKLNVTASGYGAYSGDFMWVSQDQKINGVSGASTGAVIIAAVEFIL